MLGEYSCGSGWCLALVRSTDAGKHFRRAGLPPFPSQGTVASVVFANARDGFAFISYEGPLYVTHDGGLSWHRAEPAGHVIAFAAGGGYAYVVTTLHRLVRARVSHDAWHVLRRIGGRVSLAVRGSHVWLLGPPRRQPDYDTLARSGDGGRKFTTGRGPCFAELGGGVVPAGDGVVWGVCPTGMMSGTWRSTNGGRSFSAVRTQGQTNGAAIVALTPRAAILYRGVEGPLLRTTDGGRHWRPLRGTRAAKGFSSIGFTTRRVGFAIVQVRDTGVLYELWQTTNGGATWRTVPIR